MHHLMINPEHPLVLVVDGVEGLNRKDYGSFFHSIQLFAKIPPFVTEPPGIASVFMHDVCFPSLFCLFVFLSYPMVSFLLLELA